MPQEHPQATSLLLTPEFKTQPQERLTARQCLSTTKLRARMTDRPFQPTTPLMAEESQPLETTAPQDREGALLPHRAGPEFHCWPQPSCLSHHLVTAVLCERLPVTFTFKTL